MWEIQEAPADGIHSCSFCGQSLSEKAEFTQGPGGVCICDECIEICRDTIEKERHVDFDQLKQTLASRRKLTTNEG